MSGVALRTLLDEGYGLQIIGDDQVIVKGVRHDSRSVLPGDLFMALGGRVFDGADYTRDAIARGAVAIAAEQALAVDVPLLVVSDAERTLSSLATRIYGNATNDLAVVGITGTNGKTTVAYLVEQMLQAAQQKPAVIGTVNVRGPGGTRPATHTTPMADEVMRIAAWARDTGASHLIIEVSSHGLVMKRVEDVQFRVAAFTNLSQDHLDFHSTLEEYAAAKDRLFCDLHPQVSVINVDDGHGRDLSKRSNGQLLRFSAIGAPEAEVRVLTSKCDRQGIEATVQTPSGVVELRSHLLGAHNLSNLCCALAIGLGLGLDASVLSRALSAAQGAPGRLQRVGLDKRALVFVDYAHTPDALANVCAALRSLTEGRLLVVFGCGGDRDRSKRPLMGSMVSSFADVAIVTSDNPRNEDPQVIINDILPGMSSLGSSPMDVAAIKAGRSGYHVEIDRKRAIDLAVDAARVGDTVLIAGKGHENYQIVGATRLPFDDVAVAEQALERAAEAR